MQTPETRVREQPGTESAYKTLTADEQRLQELENPKAVLTEGELRQVKGLREAGLGKGETDQQLLIAMLQANVRATQNFLERETAYRNSR